MPEDVSKIRVHSLTFSEEEFAALVNLIDEEIGSNNLKDHYPIVWKLMNRMSYTSAHGTEAGWSD